MAAYHLVSPLCHTFLPSFHTPGRSSCPPTWASASQGAFQKQRVRNFPGMSTSPLIMYIMGGKNTDFRVRQNWVWTQLCYLMAVCSWSSCFTSLSLRIPLRKNWIHWCACSEGWWGRPKAASVKGSAHRKPLINVYSLPLVSSAGMHFQSCHPWGGGSFPRFTMGTEGPAHSACLA